MNEQEYKEALVLYFKGEIKACPQCRQINGHHKMDCSVRYYERTNVIRKNRYGDTYWWEEIDEPNHYAFMMEGNSMKWCRSSWNEETGDITMFDPSGGPFISVGSSLDGKTIKRIFVYGDTYGVEVSDE